MTSLKKTISALALSLVMLSLVVLSLVMRSLVMLCTADLMAGEQDSSSTTSGYFFERLDANKDGKVTSAEAPAQGKMRVEFLLSRAGKKASDPPSQQDFMRIVSFSHNRRNTHLPGHVTCGFVRSRHEIGSKSRPVSGKRSPSMVKSGTL